MVTVSSQHINGELHSLWTKLELHSWSVIGGMVNQQINRNMLAINGDLHLLRENFRVFFLFSDGQDDKSADQREYVHYTLYFL